MDIITIPRGFGKTHQLIKKSALTGDYIVCMNENEVSRIMAEASLMGLNIPSPISFDEFLGNQYYSSGIKGFLIDNAELLIQRLSPRVPIHAITLTK